MTEETPFLEANPHLREFMQLLSIARQESDRGAVLVHASMIDELLKRSIEARMVDHVDVAKLTNGFNAPIGTFSSRGLLAFALGVISETEYRDIVSIRKIRNDFAHSIEMSFKDQSVIARCNSLIYAAQDYGEVHVDPRGRFLTAAASIILSLVNRAHYVSKQRLVYGGWKH